MTPPPLPESIIGRAKDVFFEALAQASSERERFVERATAGDPVLARAVHGLLAAHEAAGDFLEPASEPHLLLTGGASLPEPGSRVGPYRLLERLGEGGFGIVFLAQQLEPVARRVALKVLKAHSDTGSIAARFEQERQALALMDHPGIAKVLDAGTTASGRPYFVMEYVPGLSITLHCDQARLSLVQRLELFERVCLAVQHAHQKGVVHRDLKASNVLVTTIDGHAQPKVIDFGIAKAIGPRLTELTLVTQHVLGTPEAMSPEQASSPEDVDTRTDVYSLGVLLYELLTGLSPYDRERMQSAGLAEVARMICEEEPARPSGRLRRAGETVLELAQARQTTPERLARHLRGDLDWIVMKALEKDRARRYSTASALAADIRGHLDDEPVSAGPPSAAYRLRKLCRRHRAWVMAGVLVVAALGLATVVSTSAAVATARARDEARRLLLVAEQQGYVANIFAAESALRLNDSDTARRRLTTAPAALRGWEWQHLSEMTDRSAWTVEAESRIDSHALSPERERVVLTTRAGRIGVADLVRRQFVWWADGHQDLVRSCVWLPDGARVVTGGREGEIRLSDAANGAVLVERRPHTAPIVHLAAHPSQPWVVSSSEDGSLLVLDAATLQPVRELAAGLAPINRCALSADGRWAAVGTWDQRLLAFEVASGEVVLDRPSSAAPPPIPRPERFPPAEVMALDFDAQRARLFAGTRDGDVAIYDLESGAELARRELEYLVRDIDLRGDGARLAAGTSDGKLHVLAVPSLEVLHTYTDHTGDVRGVAFAPQGSTLVSASWDNTLKLWDDELRLCIATLHGHRSGLFGVELLPGDRALSLANDGLLKLWELAPARLDAALRVGANIHGIGVLDAWRAVVLAVGRGVHVLDLRTGRSRLVALDVKPSALAVDARRDRIATGSLDGSLRLWDIGSGALLAEVGTHEREVLALELSDDGQWLLSSSRDHTARLWNLESGGLVATYRDHVDEVTEAIFCLDGERVATVSHDARLRLFETESGALLARIALGEEWIACLASHPSGRLLAAGSHDRRVYLVDPLAGAVTMRLEGHNNSVHDLAWLPDASRLVTAGADGTLRLWDLAARENVGTLASTEAPLQSLCITPDGLRILAGGDDQVLRTWAISALPH